MLNGACYKHGGASLAGAASPAFKHGGNSKYLHLLHGTIRDSYVQAVTDPELLNLSAELALTEGRIAGALEQLRDGASGDRFGAISEAVGALERAAREGSPAGVATAVGQLRLLVAGGLRDAALQRELDTQIDLKRRLAAAQARILRDMHQTLTFGQVMEVIAQVADIVRRNVTDPKQVTAVVVDLSRLLHSGAGATADAGRSGDD